MRWVNGGTFIDDGQFRRALLLTGDGSHLQLPGAAPTGEDTLSVIGWTIGSMKGRSPG